MKFLTPFFCPHTPQYRTGQPHPQYSFLSIYSVTICHYNLHDSHHHLRVNFCHYWHWHINYKCCGLCCIWIFPANIFVWSSVRCSRVVAAKVKICSSDNRKQKRREGRRVPAGNTSEQPGMDKLEPTKILLELPIREVTFLKTKWSQLLKSKEENEKNPIFTPLWRLRRDHNYISCDDEVMHCERALEQNTSVSFQFSSRWSWSLPDLIRCFCNPAHGGAYGILTPLQLLRWP